jgi:hypothetical protein
VGALSISVSKGSGAGGMLDKFTAGNLRSDDKVTQKKIQKKASGNIVASGKKGNKDEKERAFEFLDRDKIRDVRLYLYRLDI